MAAKFRALRVEAVAGGYERAIVERSTDDLPSGDLLIRVHYSSLNYKDALSATGHRGITRQYPHTPGIDAAGVVVESASLAFGAGEEVLVTGFDLGMNTDGGYGGYIRVPAEWAVPLPAGMSLEESMVLGTAGFTAGLALLKLETNGLHPGAGPVVVTGASGGVGSLAVSILAARGYEVWAGSGKPEARAMLLELGAREVIPREELNDQSGRPLLKSRWAGAIDTVGGNTLATLLKSVRREGSVAVCGLVSSHELSTTVYPFLLNGANLLGVDSATCPKAWRNRVWELLAGPWQCGPVHSASISLDELDPYFSLILAGRTQGRIVIRHD